MKQPVAKIPTRKLVLFMSSITGYEPMKDAGGKVIGIYYVGYKK